MSKKEWDIEFSGMNSQQLAVEMNNLREQYDALKAQSNALWEKHQYLAYNVLPDQMAEEDIRSVAIASIGKRLQVQSQTTCKTKDSAALQAWLEDEGADDLIKPTVNSSTLKAFLKERFDNGRELPPEEVVVFDMSPLATLTKI